jgi:hypothetical protein
MNEIRISVTLSLDESQPDDAYIDFNLSVDGQYLHDPNVYVDPVDLVTSSTMSGEFFIYTCDCGDPSCLGIDDGVMVSHAPDSVKWRLRNPISWPPGDPMPDWAHDGEFTFSKEQYVQQIAMALDHAKRLARAFTVTGSLWAGPDLSVEGLLALEMPRQGGFFIADPDEQVMH